uniref:CSON008439 protein n=1 Tax=Culicoides sonorensis TaxID=179676 RepID=A0A336LNT6_CULSO
MSHKLTKSVLLFAFLFAFIQNNVCYAKNINITNAWTLPGHGYPVFYRYFRDKVTWYEADAVCQFHHGNLATVNNGAQFDAVHALLNEIDVSTNTWIGLTRPDPHEKFKWTNREFSDLSTPYWAEALPETESSLCAAIDPVQDYRWHAMPCGGPSAASFLCELKVPEWAFKCTTNSLSSITYYDTESGKIHLTHMCDRDTMKLSICGADTKLATIERELSCDQIEESPLSPQLAAEFSEFYEGKSKNHKKQAWKKVSSAINNKKHQTKPKSVNHQIVDDEMMQGDEPAKKEETISSTTTEMNTISTETTSIDPVSSSPIVDETESPSMYFTDFTDYTSPDDRTKRETVPMESSTVSMTLPNGVKKHSSSKHHFSPKDYAKHRGRKLGKSNPQLYSPQVMRKEFDRPRISNITTQRSDDKKQQTGDMFVPPMLLVKSNFPHHTIENRPIATTEPSYSNQMSTDQSFTDFDNFNETFDENNELTTDDSLLDTFTHNTVLETSTDDTSAGTTIAASVNLPKNNTEVSDSVSLAPTTPAPITVPEKMKPHTEALKADHDSTRKPEIVETSAENHVDHHNESDLNGEDEDPHKPNRHRVLTEGPSTSYIKKVLG